MEELKPPAWRSVLLDTAPGGVFVRMSSLEASARLGKESPGMVAVSWTLSARSSDGGSA